MNAESPLKALESDPYSIQSLRYPLDLGSTRYGHFINFTAMEPAVPGYTQKISQQIDQAGITNTQSGSMFNRIVSAYNEFESDFGSLINSSISDVASTASKSISDKTKEYYKIIMERGKFIPKESVSLYMPDTIMLNQQVNYDNISLTELLGNIGFAVEGVSRGSSILDAITSDASMTEKFKTLSSEPIFEEMAGRFIGGSSMAGFALSKSGRAINPQMEVIFKNVHFRNFQYNFNFTPKNQKETEEVHKIITFFRKHQLPSIDTGGVGRYYTLPSQFQINYSFNGKENGYLHKFSPVVLRSVVVDYSQHGWATHADGSPVHIVMILHFQEIDIMTREKVEQGY